MRLMHENHLKILKKKKKEKKRKRTTDINEKIEDVNKK